MSAAIPYSPCPHWTSPMTRTLEVTFHGAARTVTGSCTEVCCGGTRLLVDCGLFQGSRALETLNHAPWSFAPADIAAVILTHAHIDHSGLLPRLVAEGFAGPIWCTSATRDLLGAMLPDAARIQIGEAERRNRRADRADEPAIAPLYTEADAERAIAQVRCVEIGTAFEPAPSLQARLWNAGHILGSASLELRSDAVSMLFSGDLGPTNKTFHAPPLGPVGIDHVICESTYGDRDREALSSAARRAILKQEVDRAIARGGNLVIPVFAVERTQELLYDLSVLLDAHEIGDRPVFIDSPLASRVTHIFAKHRDALADTGASPLFRHDAFHFVESTAESIRLNSLTGVIILAASGMCEAGRIRHHLAHNLPRSDATILFVGFQAAGSLGRTLRDGARRVRISGQDIAVRATIRAIDCYSAHADQSDLLAWIAARQPIAGTLFLDHGEPGAIQALTDRVGATVGDVVQPQIGECYRLEQARAAVRIGTGVPGIEEATGRDWQNDYAAFAVALKARLRDIRGERARREALARMQHVLDGYRIAHPRGGARSAQQRKSRQHGHRHAGK